MRFVDFIIFLCALITAGSTFAIAVEIIVGWDHAWPMLQSLWRDSGLQEYLPATAAPSNPVPAAAN